MTFIRQSIDGVEPARSLHSTFVARGYSVDESAVTLAMVETIVPKSQIAAIPIRNATEMPSVGPFSGNSHVQLAGTGAMMLAASVQPFL